MSDTPAKPNEPRRRGLGRGLESLIPVPRDGQGGSVPIMVAVDRVTASPQQARRVFDEEKLRELAESIRLYGVLQPLLIRRLASGFELLAGERRLRAARMAGLAQVPALVREVDDESTRLLLGLIENLQRSDLDPIDEALGYRRLLIDHGLTQEAVAAGLGRSRVSVAQSLRLLDAAPAVQSALSAGAISPGHGRALAGLQPADQERGLKLTLARRLSVRELETWAREEAQPRELPRPRAQPVGDAPDGLEGLAARGSDALGHPVAFSGLPRGRVTITYRSRAELERLLSRLAELNPGLNPNASDSSTAPEQHRDR